MLKEGNPKACLTKGSYAGCHTRWHGLESHLLQAGTCLGQKSTPPSILQAVAIDASYTTTLYNMCIMVLGMDCRYSSKDITLYREIRYISVHCTII